MTQLFPESNVITYPYLLNEMNIGTELLFFYRFETRAGAEMFHSLPYVLYKGKKNKPNQMRIGTSIEIKRGGRKSREILPSRGTKERKILKAVMKMNRSYIGTGIVVYPIYFFRIRI